MILFQNQKTNDSDEKKRNSASSGHLMMIPSSNQQIWRHSELGFGRDIPIKQGYLMKKSKKHKKLQRGEWKKKNLLLLIKMENYHIIII